MRDVRTVMPLSRRGAVAVWAGIGAMVGALSWTLPALADGALAIGLPANVAQEGVAMGYAVNHKTRAEAEARALQECKQSPGAPESTRELCKVIQSFSSECVSIAMDPGDGTPGVGWAVTASRQTAETTAMARCLETAGPDRQQFCQTQVTRCDGQR